MHAKQDSQLSPDWAWVPDEVLELIFELLEGSVESSAGAGAARATCRHWCHILTPRRLSLYPRSRGGALPHRWTESFPQIRTLDLGRCLNADDSWLISITRLSCLSSLSIRGSERVTSIGMSALEPLAESLTSLDLTGCRRIGDQALVAVAALTGLASLSLSGCRTLSDAGVARLAAELPALSRLEAAMCPKLTDTALEALSRAKAIKELLLPGCRQVTDTGVQKVCWALLLKGDFPPKARNCPPHPSNAHPRTVSIP